MGGYGEKVRYGEREGRGKKKGEKGRREGGG